METIITALKLLHIKEPKLNIKLYLHLIHYIFLGWINSTPCCLTSWYHPTYLIYNCWSTLAFYNPDVSLLIFARVPNYVLCVCSSCHVYMSSFLFYIFHFVYHVCLFTLINFCLFVGHYQLCLSLTPRSI